jgi:hypothetical protein
MPTPTSSEMLLQEQANLVCQGAIGEIIKQAERAALLRMKVREQRCCLETTVLSPGCS